MFFQNKIKTKRIIRFSFHLVNVLLWALYLYMNSKIDVAQTVDYVQGFAEIAIVFSILLLICLSFRKSTNNFEQIIIDIVTVLFTLGPSMLVSICILWLYRFNREFFRLETNAQLYVTFPFMYFLLWLIVHVTYFFGTIRSISQQSNSKENIYTRI